MIVSHDPQPETDPLYSIHPRVLAERMGALVLRLLRADRSVRDAASIAAHFANQVLAGEAPKPLDAIDDTVGWLQVNGRVVARANGRVQ